MNSLIFCTRPSAKQSVIAIRRRWPNLIVDFNEAYLMFAPHSLTCSFLTYDIPGLNNQLITDNGN